MRVFAIPNNVGIRIVVQSPILMSGLPKRNDKMHNKVCVQHSFSDPLGTNLLSPESQCPRDTEVVEFDNFSCWRMHALAVILNSIAESGSDFSFTQWRRLRRVGQRLAPAPWAPKSYVILPFNCTFFVWFCVCVCVCVCVLWFCVLKSIQTT